MALSERIKATTRDGLALVCDTVLTSNTLAREFLSKPKMWRGAKHIQPVRVTANTNTTSFRSMDLLPNTSTETTKNMEFEVKGVANNVALSQQEIDLNASDKSVNDLVKFKLEEAALDMAESIGNMFYSDGTGNDGKDFNGLGNIVDDGTTASTIGGLSRTTYPTLKSTVTATGGTLTLNQMVTMFNTISDGSLQPNMIICNKTVNALYEKIAQTLNQYVSLPAGSGKYSAGATALTFKGIPVLSDAKATAQTMFFLNTKFIDWVMLKSNKYEAVNYTVSAMDGSPDESVKGLGFASSGWIESYNQYAANLFIILQGELIPKDPGRQGKLTGITTA